MNTLLKTLPAVNKDLSCQGLEDSTAKGLHSFLATFNLVASLVVIGTVHSRLARAFDVFQKQNVFV